MEERNLILEHWKKERQGFQKSLNKLRNRITKSGVHDIRVCIKKMKAYRKLYYLLNPSETKIKLKETNELYDVLGKLRNIHICLGIISEYEKKDSIHYAEFKAFLHLKSKQASSWAKHALKDYEDKDLEAFEALLQTDPIQQQEIRIEEQVKNNLSGLEPFMQQTHQLRIHLKRAYYWEKTLSNEQIEKKNQLEKINNILEKLGEWQDNEVLMQEADSFRKTFLPIQFKEHQHLKELKKNLLIKKDFLKNESVFLLPIAHESLT